MHDTFTPKTQSRAILITQDQPDPKHNLKYQRTTNNLSPLLTHTMKKVLLYVVGILLFVSQFARIFSSRTHMSHQRVMVVTAHPDDESMFFGPTIRHIADPAKNNTIYLLVMSNGNSEGLGTVRAQEQYNAAEKLGIPRDNVVVIDDPKLPDSMEAEWETELVASHVSGYFDLWHPETVITFDDYGVSNHANHKATYAGVLLATLPVVKEDPKFSMMTLYSVPLWRKYLFTADGLVTKLMRNFKIQYQLMISTTDYHFINVALREHKSQMTWYRNLWSLFSRYMVVNELSEVNFGKALRSEVFEDEIKEKAKQAWELRERAENKQTKVERPKGSGTKPAKKKSAKATNTAVTRQKPDFSILPVVEQTASENAKATDIVHEEL